MAKKMTPLVSIIIPVYNGENYLAEAINSALAQTYDNIEIIVINDGSTDSTKEIALSYGNKIRYYSKKNGGVSTALNMGISLMHGEYFSWLSHDDLYLPDKVKCQVNALANNPNRIAYSDYDVIDKNGTVIATMDIAKHYPKYDLTFGLFPILRQVLNGCSLLIHKSHFASIGMFDEDLRSVQDYDLWFRMFRGVKLTYVNELLVSQRQHSAQVTHNYKYGRDEADLLWLKTLKSITEAEACQMDGNLLEFWDNQVEFLRYTGYKSAREHARTRLAALGGGKITFVRLIKRVTYTILSFVARLVRFLRIKKLVEKNRFISWGYKLWFGVRYK